MFFGVAAFCGYAFFILQTVMEKEKTAVFIGSRDCYQLDESKIEQAIVSSIRNGIEVFLNGGQGHFDRISAAVVHRLKKQYPQVKNILVIPYHDFKVFNDSLFDEIIFPFEEQALSYYTYKGNIPKRNRIMVEWSSVAICYVLPAGGAAKTLEYAKQKGLEIIDLSAR